MLANKQIQTTKDNPKRINKAKIKINLDKLFMMVDILKKFKNSFEI